MRLLIMNHIQQLKSTIKQLIMNYHEDDRAQRLLDVFPLEKGQINISYINSTEHIVAKTNTKNKLTIGFV